MVKKTCKFGIIVMMACAAVCFSGCIFPTTVQQPEPVSGNGTIHLFTADNDTYSLVSANGDRYYPLHLLSPFKSDGMAVAYTIQENTTASGVLGAGKPADIIELVALSPPGSMIAATGNLHYVDLEGGFYGISVDKGSKYGTVDFFPINLDEQFKINNITVRFAGVPQRDVMTTVMWGIPVQITEMERV